MDRRKLLAGMASSSAALTGFSSSAIAKNYDGKPSDVEEALERIKTAIKKDEKLSKTHGKNIQHHVSKVLEELPKNLTRELVEKYASADFRLDQPDVSTHSRNGSSWALGESYVYYDWPFRADTEVAYWIQEIEWEWEGDELNYADERYYSRITDAGRADQWTIRNSDVRDETGGKGEGRYRLFTSAKFGLCPQIGPIGGCIANASVWVDMAVEAGNNSAEIETKNEIGKK